MQGIRCHCQGPWWELAPLVGQASAVFECSPWFVARVLAHLRIATVAARIAAAVHARAAPPPGRARWLSAAAGPAWGAGAPPGGGAALVYGPYCTIVDPIPLSWLDPWSLLALLIPIGSILYILYMDCLWILTYMDPQDPVCMGTLRCCQRELLYHCGDLCRYARKARGQ